MFDSLCLSGQLLWVESLSSWKHFTWEDTNKQLCDGRLRYVLFDTQTSVPMPMTVPYPSPAGTPFMSRPPANTKKDLCSFLDMTLIACLRTRMSRGTCEQDHLAFWTLLTRVLPHAVVSASVLSQILGCTSLELNPTKNDLSRVFGPRLRWNTVHTVHSTTQYAQYTSTYHHTSSSNLFSSSSRYCGFGTTALFRSLGAARNWFLSMKWCGEAGRFVITVTAA
mmetsp:Transcript_38627/g.99193  ORF Transcript_38627/g.99193 Transcript_38627/m.99193 type:complete len:223 (-) Transcript_38627:134-802(-)